MNQEMEEKPWYWMDNVDEIDSPQLVIYPERAEQNIRQAISMIGDVNRLRPHVKTVKSSYMIKLMIDLGIQKFKCATIAEAELLAQCHAPDVLLAYQPIGPKLVRFMRLMIEYPKTSFSCLLDNLSAGEQLSYFAVQENLPVSIHLDLNVGMNRTGIKPGEEAIELYKNLYKMPCINMLGLHAYDGHIHEADFDGRKLACEKAFEPVAAMREELLISGIKKVDVVAGGSPTFPFHLKREDVECSPGTFPYWDKGYGDAFMEQDFQPAALVISRIISMPDETTICLDLGHKSIASENILPKRAYLLNAPDLEFIGHSEEHLTMKVEAGHSYKIGDVFYALPWHICPTVALYEKAAVVKERELCGYWPNEARDRKITI